MGEETTYRIEIAGTTHLTFEVGALSNFGMVVRIVNYQDICMSDENNKNKSDEIHVFVKKSNGEFERIVFHTSNPYLIVFRRYKKGTKK